MSNEIPRTIRIDLATPAEVAIRAAETAVENLGADVRLTQAATKLQEARALVGEYVNDQLKGVSL